jgi:hypothetical protein
MQKANNLQDSVSKILHIDNKLEQDEMEGVEDKEWVRKCSHKWRRHPITRHPINGSLRLLAGQFIPRLFIAALLITTPY